MPVWCENILHVRGQRPNVNTLVESVRSDDLDIIGKPMHVDFRRIVTPPKKIQAGLAKLSKFDDPITKDAKHCAAAAKAYWWCVKHWGTKWNASNSDVVPRKYGADLTFDTAWAAPLPIIFKLLEQYPMLAFSLHYRLEDKTRYSFFDFPKDE